MTVTGVHKGLVTDKATTVRGNKKAILTDSITSTFNDGGSRPSFTLLKTFELTSIQVTYNELGGHDLQDGPTWD